MKVSENSVDVRRDRRASVCTQHTLALSHSGAVATVWFDSALVQEKAVWQGAACRLIGHGGACLARRIEATTVALAPGARRRRCPGDWNSSAVDGALLRETAVTSNEKWFHSSRLVTRTKEPSIPESIDVMKTSMRNESDDEKRIRFAGASLRDALFTDFDAS